MKRRSCPIVDDRSSLMPAPQSEPATCPGMTRNVVGQLEQPVEAVEEPLGAVACVDREIGAGGGADEQRVPGEERVAGEKAAVLRAVARRVQRPAP